MNATEWAKLGPVSKWAAPEDVVEGTWDVSPALTRLTRYVTLPNWREFGWMPF